MSEKVCFSINLGSHFLYEKYLVKFELDRAWSSVGLETGYRQPFEIQRHTLMSYIIKDLKPVCIL